MKKHPVKTMAGDNIQPFSKELSDAQGKLTNVLTTTIKYFERNVFPTAVEIIKYKMLDSSERALLLQKVYGADWKFRSNEVYPLIQQMADVFCANLYDSDTRARAIAFKEDDQPKTEMAQDFFDWAYGASNAAEEKELIRNEATLLGMSYGRAGYRVEKKDIEYIVDGVKKKAPTREISAPELSHIDYFSIFLPPRTKDFYRAKWIAYRYLASLEDVRAKYEKSLGISFSDKEELIKATPISNYDYSRVYDAKGIGKEILEKVDGVTVNSSENKSYHDEMFYIDMEKNKTIEVIEYREGDRLCLLLNGILKYDGINPYPDKAPFVICTYEKSAGSFIGTGIGHKLLGLQKEADLVHNGIKDALTMGLFPMFTVPAGTLKNAQGVTPSILYWTPSKVVEVKPQVGSNAGIETLELSDLKYVQAGREELSRILTQANEIIGVNSYISGGQSKVERTSTGVNQRITAMRSRLAPILLSLDRLDAELFQQWLSMATVFMENEVKVRILGEDGAERWSEIKISDILNRFDVIVESESNRAATKELRSAQSLDAVMKLSAINKNPITGMPYYDIFPAIKQVSENFNFPALALLTPEELKKQVEMKKAFDVILGINSTPVGGEGAVATGTPLGSVDPSQMPGGTSQEAVVSGFAGDLTKDMNRGASQI